MATFYQKMALLKGLLTGEVAKTGPFYVDVDLTRRCNLRCLGCPYHSPYVNITPPPNPAVADLSLDLFKRLCNELGAMDTRQLILQGAGEPFLHPNLSEMVSTAKAAGFHIILLTNGTLLDQDAIQALMDARLDILKVSLWAGSTEQYQQNYPGTNPNNFRKIVDGLKLLASLKAERRSMLPKVIIYHVINRHNFQTIDAMVDLASTAGCNGLFFSPMHNAHRALDSFMLSADEERLVQLSLSRARKRLKSLSIEHNIDLALLRYKTGSVMWQIPCYITWFHAKIRVDGMVQACGRCDSNVDFGNLHEYTFHEIWNGPAIRAFRRQTLTSRGLESISKYCDCTMCCFVGDNIRVHRFFRWVSPFLRRFRN